MLLLSPIHSPAHQLVMISRRRTSQTAARLRLSFNNYLFFGPKGADSLGPLPPPPPSRPRRERLRSRRGAGHRCGGSGCTAAWCWKACAARWPQAAQPSLRLESGGGWGLGRGWGAESKRGGGGEGVKGCVWRAGGNCCLGFPKKEVPSKKARSHTDMHV